MIDKDKKTLHSLLNQVEIFNKKNKFDHFSFANDKLTNIVANFNNNKPKGQKKKLKNIIDELKNKTFIYDISPDLFSAFMLNNENKLLSFSIRRMKASGGSIYVIMAMDGSYFFVKSHFFDRYAERLNNEKVKTRKETIRHFIKSLPENTDCQLASDGQIMKKYKFGVGLGYYEKNETINILLNTFVSYDMLRQDQKQILGIA